VVVAVDLVTRFVGCNPPIVVLFSLNRDQEILINVPIQQICIRILVLLKQTNSNCSIGESSWRGVGRV